MAVKSAHWSYTTNADGTTTHFLLSPEGTRSNVPVTATDANDNTVLVGADGVQYPLSLSNSLLSVTTLSMTTSLTVETSAGQGTPIVFDTVLRDDLGLAITGTGRIRIPNTATQMRLIMDINLTSTIVGTYRRIAPIIVVAGNNTASALIPLGHKSVVPFSAVTTGVVPGFSVSSGLIDIPAFLTSLTLDWAGDNTDYFAVGLRHDATAGTIQVLAGSSISLEVYTPA